MERERERSLVRTARKDPEAFAELYDSYFPRVLAYAFARTGSLADAEDVTAETFLRALRGLPRFRWRGGGFLPWLYRIASHRIVDLHRSRRRGERARRFARSLPPPVRDELEAHERERRGGRLADALTRSLDDLEPRDRTILALRYLQGESYAVIAEATGIKEPTVRVRAHRARRRMEQQLKEEGWDHDEVRAAGWAAGLSGLGAEVSGVPETAADL